MLEGWLDYHRADPGLEVPGPGRRPAQDRLGAAVRTLPARARPAHGGGGAQLVPQGAGRRRSRARSTTATRTATASSTSPRRTPGRRRTAPGSAEIEAARQERGALRARRPVRGQEQVHRQALQPAVDLHPHDRGVRAPQRSRRPDPRADRRGHGRLRARAGTATPRRHRARRRAPVVHPCGASSACQLPKWRRTQQSCAGASNRDHRNAPGHRGCLGRLRLCDRPATARSRRPVRARSVLGAPPGRQGRAPDRAGAGPRGPGDDRPVPAPVGTRVRTPPYGTFGTRRGPGGPSPPRPRRPAAAPGAPAAGAPRGSPSAQGDGSGGHGCVRPGQAVRRLEPGQPAGDHLRPDVTYGTPIPSHQARPARRHGRCRGGPSVSPPASPRPGVGPASVRRPARAPPRRASAPGGRCPPGHRPRTRRRRARPRVSRARRRWLRAASERPSFT